MSQTLITTITDGQKKQVRRFAEDAVDRTIAEGLLDKDGIQRLIEKGDEFQADIITSIKKHSLSNQFANEEVESTYSYLSGYTSPRSITEQTNILRHLIPGLGFANERLAEGPVPSNSEGWFAIPKWQTIAPTYGEAVQKVLDAIKKARNGKFHNYREGQINNSRLRQTAKTAVMFQKLEREQKEHDILVVAAQFGIRHRGRSVRRAREVFARNEFGLGAFAVGIMILTHAERFQHPDDLWIDCAGDEFDDPAAGVRFDRATCFFFDDGQVKFDSIWFGDAYYNYGSASAFLPAEALA